MERGQSKLAIITAVIVVVSSVGVNAQQTSWLAEGYLSFGGAAQSQSQLGLSDWRSLLPGSMILQQDVPVDRDHGSFYGNDHFRDDQNYGGGSAFLGVGLALGQGSSEGAKFEKRLRLGVNFTGHAVESNYWRNDATARFDTLISQSTGELFFRDTTYSERYSASATASRIGLDASFVLRKLSSSRWSWYVGAGALVGTTFNGEARVSYTVARSDESDLSNSGSNTTEETNEFHRLQSNVWGAGYAIAGVDFKLGRTSPFWSGLHLFYELRPMLLFNGSSVVKQAQGITQNLFGLRFDLR